MKNEIINYCSEQGITMEQLSKMTKTSVSQLYLINKNPKYDVKIETINKIYVGTKNKLGEGLTASEYLDFECLNVI